MLRHGIKPELYAFSAVVVAFTFAIVVLLFGLIRWGIIEREGS
jgi:hypothetical protein